MRLRRWSPLVCAGHFRGPVTSPPTCLLNSYTEAWHRSPRLLQEGRVQDKEAVQQLGFDCPVLMLEGSPSPRGCDGEASADEGDRARLQIQPPAPVR